MTGTTSIPSFVIPPRPPLLRAVRPHGTGRSMQLMQACAAQDVALPEEPLSEELPDPDEPEPPDDFLSPPLRT